jgi:hypothetical protein
VEVVLDVRVELPHCELALSLYLAVVQQHYQPGHLHVCWQCLERGHFCLERCLDVAVDLVRHLLEAPVVGFAKRVAEDAQVGQRRDWDAAVDGNLFEVPDLTQSH